MTAILLTDDTATREQWLAARQAGIGASEIAAVLGISPWDSPFSLFWRKRTGVGDDIDTDDMEWGRRLEAAVAGKFADQHHDLTVASGGGLWAHPDRPWQLATPDRLLYTGVNTDGQPDALLECKTAGSYDEWGDDGSDVIPVHYRAQVIQQMDVLGCRRAYMPCLFNGRVYREYVIEYDPADAAVIAAAGEAFMTRLTADDAPPVDWSGATTRALKRLHPSVTDEVVEVSADLAAEWATAKAAEKAAKQRVAAIENALRAAIGTAKAASHDGRRIATRSVFDRAGYTVQPTTIDQLRLVPERATHPTAITVRSTAA